MNLWIYSFSGWFFINEMEIATKFIKQILFSLLEKYGRKKKTLSRYIEIALDRREWTLNALHFLFSWRFILIKLRELSWENKEILYCNMNNMKNATFFMFVPLSLHSQIFARKKRQKKTEMNWSNGYPKRYFSINL